MRKLFGLFLCTSLAYADQLVLKVEGEANGNIVIELAEDIAPAHIERIKLLTGEGAYDDVVFHRVIEGFMAQTGDVQYGRVSGEIALAGSGGSSYPDLPAEFSEAPFVRGTVGMARAQHPNSANSQFFIMFADGAFLNGQYTVIGEVVEGMEVVDAIKKGVSSLNGQIEGVPDKIVSASIVEK